MSLKSSIKQIEFDYSYYLGPGYTKAEKAPTYVANHPSVFDILVMIKYFGVSFAAKRRVKKIPLFGTIVQAMGCIFIKRSGPIEVRDKAVEIIGDRQS